MSTETAATTTAAPQLLPGVAEYLAGVLQRVAPLRPLGIALAEAYGSVLAEQGVAAGPVPAFDVAGVDGYAIRVDDVAPATATEPVRLAVLGDLYAASWHPARVSPGACFAIAAGAPLPDGADAVVPTGWTDGGRAAVEVLRPPRRGEHVRRAASEVEAGAVLGEVGDPVTAALIGLLSATGARAVMVQPRPRVMVISTGDELVDDGAPGRPGQVADANSAALAAAAVEAGATAYRLGVAADDGDALRAMIADHALRADLIVTSGGTGLGPGDVLRRVLGRAGVEFVELPLHPCRVLGFGMPEEGVPMVCLPGDPGAALVGFEVLVRPVLQRLAGAEPVFRPSVKGTLLDGVVSPAGVREFRPAVVHERRGGGYTVRPLPAGEHLLSGLAQANALMVLGDRVSAAPPGTTVDVLLLDRRR